MKLILNILKCRNIIESSKQNLKYYNIVLFVREADPRQTNVSLMLSFYTQVNKSGGHRPEVQVVGTSRHYDGYSRAGDVCGHLGDKQNSLTVNVDCPYASIHLQNFTPSLTLLSYVYNHRDLSLTPYLYIHILLW